MAPAQVAVALCVPRDQCHPSTPLIRSIFPSPSLARRATARTATTSTGGSMAAAAAAARSTACAWCSMCVRLNRETRSLAVIAQYSCRRMKDGARASGGRPVCSARPMPPKHPTHQIYFPITVPRAPCDRSYGDNDDGAAAAAARSTRPLHAGRRGVQQWHVYGVGLHLRQQRRGNDCTPHSITQTSSSAHTPPEAREGCCGTLPFEWRASCVSRDQVHSNTQIIHWRFIYHRPSRLATARTATTTTDGSMAAAAAAARSTARAWCRM